MALESRRILGMHTTPGEQTPLVYSRDALSGPLRDMQSVIDEVASGVFRPDETRSGYTELMIVAFLVSSEKVLMVSAFLKVRVKTRRMKRMTPRIGSWWHGG